MSNIRIYTNQALIANQSVILSDNLKLHHLIHVLRVKPETPVILFNGDGYDYFAKITSINKKNMSIEIKAKEANLTESMLQTHLLQGITSSEKMDFIIQKSVELGVSEITPILTEKCKFKLTKEKITKKIQHWQAVIVSACEQCGRAKLPSLNPVIKLEEYLTQENNRFAMVLHPIAAKSFNDSFPAKIQQIDFIVGPESGLTEGELNKIIANNINPVKLGHRILRTETAALCFLSILQNRFGDLI